MRKVGLVLILLIAGAGIASAQFAILPLDYNILGGGARAHGMGGAFIGLADDATATSWNPAGIAQLDKPEASVVGNFSMKKYTFGEDISDPTIPLYVSESNEASSNHIAPNFFSLALPIKIMGGQNNLVFAVAYQRLIDFGFSYEEDSTTYEYSYKVKGGVDAISPAIAVQLTPKFLIGAAGNILVNGLTHTEEYKSKTNPYFDKTEKKYSISGFNINAGTLFLVNKNLSVGAAIRLPFDLKETEEYHYEQYGFASYDTTFPEMTESYPLMFGVGVAVKPNDNLTLAADYERRNYSSSEWTHKHYNTYGQIVDTTESQNYRDVNQFRVGMEYVFVGQNAVFPVRLGFRTAPQVTKYNITTTRDVSTWNVVSTDTTGFTGMVLTGGFGMKFGNIWLDLAYEFGKSDLYLIEHNYTDGSVYTSTASEKTHNIIASCIVHF